MKCLYYICVASVGKMILIKLNFVRRKRCARKADIEDEFGWMCNLCTSFFKCWLLIGTRGFLLMMTHLRLAQCIDYKDLKAFLESVDSSCFEIQPPNQQVERKKLSKLATQQESFLLHPLSSSESLTSLWANSIKEKTSFLAKDLSTHFLCQILL